MADHFYGIDVPGSEQGFGNVSTGTSTTSKKVELRVEDGVTGRSKYLVLAAIEAIKNKIIAGDAPA